MGRRTREERKIHGSSTTVSMDQARGYWEGARKKYTERKNQGEMDSEGAKEITPEHFFGVHEVPESLPGCS